MEITTITRTTVITLAVIVVVASLLLYFRIEISDKKDADLRKLLFEDSQTQRLQNHTINEIAKISAVNNETLNVLNTRFDQEFLESTLHNFEEQSDSNRTAFQILEEVREIKKILLNSSLQPTGGDIK